MESHWNYEPGEEILVKVYSNLPKVRLVLEAWEPGGQGGMENSGFLSPAQVSIPAGEPCTGHPLASPQGNRKKHSGMWLPPCRRQPQDWGRAREPGRRLACWRATTGTARTASGYPTLPGLIVPVALHGQPVLLALRSPPGGNGQHRGFLPEGFPAVEFRLPVPGTGQYPGGDPDKPNALRLVSIAYKLEQIVREEDDTRPVTLAAAFRFLSPAQVSIPAGEPCTGHPLASPR